MAEMNVLRTQPSVHNWRRFCEEPPLTDAEYKRWDELANATAADDELLTALLDAVPGERKPIIFGGSDWWDVVKAVDSVRRRMRSEIAWWEEYNDAL